MYGAVTLFGRTFQTVPLTDSSPSFTSVQYQLSAATSRYCCIADRLVTICGPATPGFPFESPGLGSSEFARHYFRNHGCFLFLRVLRWFTSPGSLRTTMYSSHDTWCSHQVGSPIRISPDHRLCASPRSFSQLTASFIAFLRLGIPTHALSSLTIKLISNTERAASACSVVVSGQWSVVSRNQPPAPSQLPLLLRSPAVYCLHGRTCNLCSCPSIFSFQRTLSGCDPLVGVQRFRLTTDHWPLTTLFFGGPG